MMETDPPFARAAEELYIDNVELNVGQHILKDFACLKLHNSKNQTETLDRCYGIGDGDPTDPYVL